MTMAAKVYEYMLSLYNSTYAQFSKSGLWSYPNINLPQHLGKVVTQYSFNTRSLPVFTDLHKLWYRWDDNLAGFVKIVPDCISEMFSAISLAHWIMEDGYFDNYGRSLTVILCTECFTKIECELLQKVLLSFGINSTLKIRDSANYRIRISKKSMPLLRELVKPYMHPSMNYKLGV